MVSVSDGFLKSDFAAEYENNSLWYHKWMTAIVLMI